MFKPFLRNIFWLAGVETILQLPKIAATKQRNTNCIENSRAVLRVYWLAFLVGGESEMSGHVSGDVVKNWQFETEPNVFVVAAAANIVNANVNIVHNNCSICNGIHPKDIDFTLLFIHTERLRCREIEAANWWFLQFSIW